MILTVDDWLFVEVTISLPDTAVNPNDRIRELMLRYFYDRNNRASTLLGTEGTALDLPRVQQELKENHRLSDSEVTSNMTYLLDRGWIKTIERRSTRPDRTSMGYGATLEGVTLYYLISARGIDRIEGESEFQVKDKFEGINITATGSSIVQLGQGNVVQAKFMDLRTELDQFKETIQRHRDFSEKEKLDLFVDVESIKDQLAKEHPNKTVIEHLWSAIENTTKVAGLIDAIHKVTPFIASVLHCPRRRVGLRQ